MTWWQSLLLVVLIIVVFCAASGWIGAYLDMQFPEAKEPDEHEQGV